MTHYVCLASECPGLFQAPLLSWGNELLALGVLLKLTIVLDAIGSTSLVGKACGGCVFLKVLSLFGEEALKVEGRKQKFSLLGGWSAHLPFPLFL